MEDKAMSYLEVSTSVSASPQKTAEKREYETKYSEAS
jgi:hypothetical protein